MVEVMADGSWVPTSQSDASPRRPPARGLRAARMERELSALMGDWGFLTSDSDGAGSGPSIKPDPDNPPPPIYISLLSDGEDDGVDDDPSFAHVRWERYRRPATSHLT